MITKLLAGMLLAAPLASLAALVAESDWEKVKEIMTIYGPMAVGLIYFAWLSKMFLTGLLKRLDNGFANLGVQIQQMNHRMHDMKRAMLLDIIARETTTPKSRAMAEQMLTETESEAPAKRMSDLT